MWETTKKKKARLTCHKELTIRRYDVARQEAVDRQPKTAHQMADSAAESEPADARVGHNASGYG